MDHQPANPARSSQQDASFMHNLAVAEPGAPNSPSSLRYTHLDDSQRYTCLHPGCEANFSNVEALDTHVYSHFSHEEPDSTFRNLQSAGTGMTYRFSQPKPIKCAVCGLAFKRPPDLLRHSKKYDPNAPRFDCRVEGCPYKGQKGFYRKDKLMSHVKCRHWQLAMGKNEQDGQEGNSVEQN